MPIPNPAQKVPMMYQAQVVGRCQLQRIVPGAAQQDAQIWVNQWTERTHPQQPQWGSRTQTRRVQFSWRLITNGGQDDGVIRPVIGANGWPFFPGSSMKGVFRRACTPEQQERYCGRDLGNGDMAPGILRFLGGYPVGTGWQSGLLDLVHPQQEWQLNGGKHSAFIQMSLYRPEMEFAISAVEELGPEEWETIWKIWDRAVATGLGCRVSAGYGQAQQKGGEILATFNLKGQGPASQLLNRDPEFRPNMFKAALRGHAMRIFGGLTDQATTEAIVRELFGGITDGDPVVGLVGMRFRVRERNGLTFRKHYGADYYQVQGSLDWLLNRPSWPGDVEPELLKKLVIRLMQFAMIFGGFGKSWRRADHRLFFVENPNYERLIGCHWQWLESSRPRFGVNQLRQIPDLIARVQEAAQDWAQSRGYPLQGHANWVETWRKNTVHVWGRVADNKDDSVAINWLHGNYADGRTIKNSPLTGRLGQIGRLWHRMYPVIVYRGQGDQRVLVQLPRFLELLTLFPDSSKNTQDFLAYLRNQTGNDGSFTRLW